MEKMSVAKKLLISYILLVFGIAILTGAFILPVQLNGLEHNLNEKISWTGRLLAEDSAIKDGLQTGTLSSECLEYLDGLIKDSGNIDYIVIADTDSVRLYHPDHSLIGENFTGGDENDVLNGSISYITTQQGSTDVQKRAFHVITDDSGNTLGFVMVSASLTTIRQEQRAIILQFALIILLILAFGILFSWLISKNIRKSLLGFEPGTFAKRYLQREEILDSLNEAVLAVDTSGNYLYRNQSAAQLFSGNSLPPDFPIRQEIQTCLQTGKSQSGLMTEMEQKTLLIHLIPIFKLDIVDGVLLIARDKTEAVQLAEQLTGTNHIVDALRANTHEYLNKLHIISGLLQIGETEEAISFISDISSDIENGYQTVVRQIQNRTVAALIIGKQSHSKELDIDFLLRKDSCLEKSNAYLSTQELVTIIGNLVENAFEAVKSMPSLRHVELFIGSGEHGLTITVDDTGSGMTEEQLEKIQNSQYTTKGEGHGFGLRLIREIVRKHDGYMEIESVPGEGTSFTLTFTKRR